jgi:lipopolysaccharide transport system ATP-binding protein
MAPAIRVDGLSKRYRLIPAGERLGERTFREDVVRLALKPFRWLVRGARRATPAEEFWALRGVSFDVAQGEVIGVIGRNGAGKSTLLKVLSRITRPTEGSVRLRGRIGSLLEVGTGFHPELSGRENVFLNGAVLGMPRAEIRRKFDEIVAFAEVEKFIDMPVKRYSSGMYMRLAFAVAAHLEPEILLVDEVLAVGDAAFQKKCLGKMEAIAGQGRTVLFVSHNMAAVARLCGRGLLLEKGQLAFEGTVERAVELYQKGAVQHTADGVSHFANRSGSGAIQFAKVRILNDKGQPELSCGGAVTVEMHLRVSRPCQARHVALGIGVNGQQGERLITLLNRFDPHARAHDVALTDGTVVKCELPRLLLRPGPYYLTLYADVNGEIADQVKDAVEIEVHEADYFGSGVLPTGSQGPFLLDQSWHYEVGGTSAEPAAGA